MNPIFYLIPPLHQYDQEMKLLQIANAGSKKVPILLIGKSRTRSGRKFRHVLPPPAHVYLPPEAAEAPQEMEPVPAEEAAPIQQDAQGAAADIPDPPQEDEHPSFSFMPNKKWVYSSVTGWYQKLYF